MQEVPALTKHLSTCAGTCLTQICTTLTVPVPWIPVPSSFSCATHLLRILHDTTLTRSVVWFHHKGLNLCRATSTITRTIVIGGGNDLIVAKARAWTLAFLPG